MAERAPEKREVTGSTPVPTTMRRAGGIVLICLLLVTAACSGGDDTDEASSFSSDSSPSEDDRDLGPLTELLAAVPDVGNNASFVIVKWRPSRTTSRTRRATTPSPR